MTAEDDRAKAFLAKETRMEAARKRANARLHGDANAAREVMGAWRPVIEREHPDNRR